MYNIAIRIKGAPKMNKGYTKFLYDDNSGFRLHHTKGRFAAESTTGYLHYDVELSLIYFIHGIGEIKIEGKKYIIEDNDLILLKPSELYHCTVKDGTYHERLVLYFNGDLLGNFKESGKVFLEAFYNRPDGFENKIPAKIVKENNIDLEIKELLNLVKDQSEVKKVVSVCKTVEILAKLRTIILSSSEKQYSQTGEDPLINNVIAYINQNFSQNISLEGIAKEFYVDKYYISHFFKEKVGVTLWNYVIFRRLTAFNDLIRANTSIEEACFRVGFQNYSNFFRLYKKHMQMTPTEFKKSIKKY
jgi:AraC-like DNA-binding protein